MLIDTSERAMARQLVRGFRLLRSNPRLFARRVLALVRDPVPTARALAATRRRTALIQAAYEAWWRDSTTTPAALQAAEGPTFSIIMPVHNTPPTYLESALASVAAQTYPNWELCVADDASTDPQVSEILERWVRQDNRLRWCIRREAGHISQASNSAMEMASGDFLVLLDHDDLLHPRALEYFAAAARTSPEVDFIYSDEDKIDEAGRHIEPFFKPAWSPLLLTSCNYITHLAGLRREVVEQLGGFRRDMVGSQDHDLFLRVAEHARAVVHVPHVLYSWRMSAHSTAGASSAKPYAVDAARRALQQAIQRRAWRATLQESHLNGIYLVRHEIRQPVRVSVIINGPGNRWCGGFGQVPGIEVAEVHHLDQPQSLGPLQGEYLLWLDGDSMAASPTSIQSLAEHFADPRVAAVGGSTRFPDGTVMQAGLTLGPSGQPHYAYHGISNLPQPNFYLNLKDLPHEVSAITPACAMVRREVWEALGGWREDLPPVLALCDLCLRASQQGFVSVYTPLARFDRVWPLPAIPSVGDHPWPWTDYADPYGNPNLNPADGAGIPFSFDPATAPRLTCPARLER